MVRDSPRRNSSRLQAEGVLALVAKHGLELVGIDIGFGLAGAIALTSSIQALRQPGIAADLTTTYTPA